MAAGACLAAAALFVPQLLDRPAPVVAPPTGGVTTTAPAAPAPPDPAAQRAAAVSNLLEQRAAAIGSGDRAAWLATLDPGATDFVQAQDHLFTTLQQLPRASWAYALTGTGRSLPAQRRAELGGEAVVVDVRLSYRLEGYDGSEVLRDQHLTVVRRDDRWLLASDRDGPVGTAPQVDVWDLGPVHVAAGANSLVLVHSDPGLETTRTGALDVAEQADRAVEVVRTAWGEDWSRRVVVVVPASLEEMARLLGVGVAGLDQVAAVTTGQVGTDGAGTTGDRIVVNPTAFAALPSAGRQVVLTHETTHVATRAVTSADVPIWLSEGYADHLAYLDGDVAVEQVAGDALEQVRAGALPSRLPSTEDFDATRGPVGPAYSLSWLAVRVIAERHGEERLRELYRAVASGSAGPSLADAFSQVLASSEAEVLEAWRTELVALSAA